MQVRERHGESKPRDGQFTCLRSDHHARLQVGAWVDQAHSARYLVHHDGTPFADESDRLRIVLAAVSRDIAVRLECSR